MCFKKRNNSLPYANPDRLADVLALIQVLALDKYTHRSESGLQEELKVKPRSTSSWAEVAKQHPEFFRYSEDSDHEISLIARHVLPKNDKEKTRKFPSDLVGKLIQIAIEIHDRQLDRAQYWKAFVPIIVAVTAGVFTIFGVFLKSWLSTGNT